MNADQPSQKHSAQRMAYGILGKRAVLVHPALVRAVGAPGALVLGQLLYWQDKKRRGNAIYKTVVQLESETGLRRRQQQTAIRRCAELGLLLVERRGLPARRHFTVHLDAVLALATSGKPHRITGTISIKQSAQSAPTTPESTAEIIQRRLQRMVGGPT